MDLGDQTQFSSLGRQHLYPLSYLAGLKSDTRWPIGNKDTKLKHTAGIQALSLSIYAKTLKLFNLSISLIIK